MVHATAARRTSVLATAVLQRAAVATFATSATFAGVRAHQDLHWSVLIHAADGTEDQRGGGAIAVGAGYHLTIGLRHCTPAGGLAAQSCAPATEHGCNVAHVSRELVEFGQAPQVIVAAPGTHEERMRVQPQLIDNSTQVNGAPCAVWVAPLPAATTAAPASLQIIVSADAYGIASTSVQTTVLRIPVLAAAGITNGTLVHAAAARPVLYTEEQLSTKSSEAGWYPKLIPGVSPLAVFAKENAAPHSSALCVTVDEFRSHVWVDLHASAGADMSVASCQGQVGAVHTRSALIFHSPTHGIEEIHSSAHRVSLSSELADLCVDRLVVASQPAPYRRGFNDIVLALEPVGWRRGTGTTIFVREEPSHEHTHSKMPVHSFHEILDHRGLNLATWASQLFPFNSARTELVVVAAAFAVTQPRTFLFLIAASSSHINEQVATTSFSRPQSTSYALVAFDGSSQRWNRRSTLDNEVRLVGLRYASSARPVLWAWGSTVLFSFDHGHSFHRVAGLPTYQATNLVVDFVSTTTDEWALLYADGTVILGCVDSEPRLGVSIGASSGQKPLSLFFTHEGALVGLSLTCSDRGVGIGDTSDKGNSPIPCAPTRSGLAHTSDAWGFSLSRRSSVDAVQAGAYTCDSSVATDLHSLFSTPSDDLAPVHMLRKRSSSGGAAESAGEHLASDSLPSRIFFDVHERYQFKLRLPVDDNLELSDWRPVAFQLNSANGGIHMSVERLWHQYVVADNLRLIRDGGVIEYTVNLRDTAKSSGPTVAAGLSLDVADMEKRSPGKDMTVATLQVLYDRDVSSGSAPCPSPATIREHQQHTITLLSGCPPGRWIKFDVESSRRVPRALNQQRVEVDHGCAESDSNVDGVHTTAAYQTTSDVSNSARNAVPCVWAGHDFYPVFRIVDDLTADEHSNIYNGSYRLTIVGGGPSLEEMEDYTPEQQEAYSMWPTSLGGKHSTPVYGFLNADLEGDSPTASGMSWICSPGSPCSHVLPRFPHTPEIFFRFRFDTTYSEGTYCDYRMEFTLRLHGLPMAFQTIVRLTFGTTAACFGLVLLSYVVRLSFFPPQQPI